MKAILTIYHGPTDFRGSRIIASEPDGKRLIMSYDHSLNSEECHRKAAYMLRDRLGWKGELVTGGLKRGYCHVFIS